MATHSPVHNPDLDKGRLIAATATASTTTPAVRFTGNDAGRKTSSNMNNNTESSTSSNMNNNTESSTSSNMNNNNNNNGSMKAGDKDKADDGLTNFKPTPRFWAILITCAVMGLLSALENTVVTTALPYIVADLNMGANYVWITNVFFLTGYVSDELCCANRDDKPR
jgi:hypothetical protein